MATSSCGSSTRGPTQPGSREEMISASSSSARGSAQPRSREELIRGLALQIFPLLPLSIQAITVPVLGKAWKQWAEEQRAKERALEGAPLSTPSTPSLCSTCRCGRRCGSTRAAT